MPFPIIIKMSAALINEFAQCEHGAHEDGEQEREYGVSAYDVLTRHKDRIEIRDAKEADLIYYAACSGTFALTGQGAHPLDDSRRNRAANRIADVLRPHAQPETVKRWRAADGY